MVRVYFLVSLTLILLGLPSAGGARADDRRGLALLSGESDRDAVARQLDAVDELIKKENWPKVIEECQAILGKNGDTLVPLTSAHFVQARLLVHDRISHLPAAALKVYRGRVDPQAKKWYDEGLATRDRNLIRRVVENAFCSRYGESALDQLGDMAFEEGRFEEALYWWRMLARPSAQVDNKQPQPARTKPSLPLFPDPKKDQALLRAKQLLALIFLGDRTNISIEMKAFRDLHGEAQGSLAGQKGNLARILDDLLKNPPPPPQQQLLEGWPTFAGSMARQGASGRLPDHPNWLARLGSEPPCVFDLSSRTVVDIKQKAREEADRASSRLPFPYHPVIVDRFVLIADASGVTLYDPLNRKSSEWAFDGQKHDLKNPPHREGDFTLTVNGHFVYVSLGEEANSQLTCLELDPAKKPPLQPRWQVSASAADEKLPWTFEGSPVVGGGRAYIAMSQGTATHSKVAIICYNAFTGTALWKREVGEAGAVDAAQNSVARHLLTWADGRLYYCSHTGMVVSLDGFTGRMHWAVRYPSFSAVVSAGEPSPRALCPCIYSEGRLFVAPADCERLLCLDAFTGALIWDRDRLEVVHLLGAGEGRLIFTTKHGIRWLEAPTGLDVQSHPDGGTGPLPSEGRGLLAGDLVFWPTKQGLHVLTQRDGNFPSDQNVYNLLHNKPMGNLALSSQLLAVAGRRELAIYQSPAKMLQQHREEQDKQPQWPHGLRRLAIADVDKASSRTNGKH
ncbi:MAG: PQQ-binding-like beta-propeller repeat protein [Gemmataceae bacterium]